jgi:hypothetical protein
LTRPRSPVDRRRSNGLEPQVPLGSPSRDQGFDSPQVHWPEALLAGQTGRLRCEIRAALSFFNQWNWPEALLAGQTGRKQRDTCSASRFLTVRRFP